MNRKELLLLAAASIFATDPLQSYSLAVMKASVLLDEVLKHQRTCRSLDRSLREYVADQSTSCITNNEGK